MAQQYGMTVQGFVTKSQQQIISDMSDDLRTAFGANINLAPTSNFGQIVGITSGEIALVWEAGQANYASQYPSGAEGVAVDNILALNNMRRLQATPTRSNPVPVTLPNGIVLNGAVVFGVAGTVVTKDSVVQTNASPPLQFTIDADTTILAAVNAIQTFVRSNVPDSGDFSLSLVDTAGNTLTTPVIPYNVLSAVTRLILSSVPGSGHYSLGLTLAGALSSTGNISAGSNAATVQAAINAVAGYSAVTVTGSESSGFLIAWNSAYNAITTVVANTTGVTITPQDSLQAVMSNLKDTVANNYPLTDMTVTDAASGYNFNFGASVPASGQPASSARAQALILIVTNTMMSGSSVTNTEVIDSVNGAPAQGIASVTCTVTGPNFVGAGSIASIATPINGWTGVTNQLDCLSGNNVEDDTDALIRRQNSLNANANGPLAAIIAKVQEVTGVLAIVGFQNLQGAALQTFAFNVPASSGTYKLVIGGNATSAIPYNATNAGVQMAIRALSGYGNTIVSGDRVAGFTVDFNGSFGGQYQNLIGVQANTTGSVITVQFGRPGHSFEIVASGGADGDIAKAILKSGPAGIQPYGSTIIQELDQFNNLYNIGFSRPTEVPIFVTISLVTDLYNIPGDHTSGLNPRSKFNPLSIADIQKDIVTIGNETSIGGLIIGFGSNGLIGAFNSVPGIISYTLYFDRVINPTTNNNLQLQPEEQPVFEEFNVAVSYT